MVKATIARNMPNRSRIIAKCVLREAGDPGSLSPAFSVTCDIYEAHGTWSGAACERNGRDIDAGGCAHDEILRAFPKLAPLVALHLSDPAGVPMHAEANALYYYRAALGLPGGWRGGRYGGHMHTGETEQGYAYRVACEILRVDEIPLEGCSADDLPGALTAFVDAQRDRWKAEADAGRALIVELAAK